MSILYSSHTSLNLVSIDVVTPVGTLNIPTSISFAYLEGLCRMEEGSDVGICQDHEGWGGRMSVGGERGS